MLTTQGRGALCLAISCVLYSGGGLKHPVSVSTQRVLLLRQRSTRDISQKHTMRMSARANSNVPTQDIYELS
jgi:hypothetical protein